jgi:hypothetical protein
LKSLDTLSELVKKAFEADKFEMGAIPLQPPPLDCR